MDVIPDTPSRRRRPSNLCRSWLFVPGANDQDIEASTKSRADVLIQELEDFTRPEDRPRARNIMDETISAWRDLGFVTAVRINPIDDEGREDLEAAMAAKPDIIALPKVDGPEKIIELDELVWNLEWTHGIEQGSTELLPNVEYAKGLILTTEVAKASRRVAACLIASEDLAADLGAERDRDGLELLWPRQRFIVDCVASEVTAVDCPWTWSDLDGLEAEAITARRLGYKAKSAVSVNHVDAINKIMTPDDASVEFAKKVVGEFESARERGESRVEVDGSIVELPIYTNAKRLLDRAAALAEFA